MKVNYEKEKKYFKFFHFDAIWKKRKVCYGNFPDHKFKMNILGSENIALMEYERILLFQWRKIFLFSESIQGMVNFNMIETFGGWKRKFFTTLISIGKLLKVIEFDRD